MTCLKDNYQLRIAQLGNITQKKIYSNSNKFEYSGGDVVLEIRPVAGKFEIDLWGGFRIHRQLSIDSGSSVYLGCEFTGVLNSPNGGRAVGLNGDFTFNISGDTVTYDDDRQNCSGFGSLPESLKLQQQRTRTN